MKKLEPFKTPGQTHIRSCLAVALATASMCSHSLQVDQLEQMIKKRMDDDVVSRSIATVSLRNYYGGLSEMLSILINDRGVLWRDGEKVACLPSKNVLSVEFVQGVVEGEIKKPENYQRVFGSEWRRQHATTFLYVGLVTMFPCK